MKETEKELLNILRNTPNQEFEILDHVGTGSYGKVFKARIVKTNELVAIKVIRLEAGEDLSDILNEINFLRSCEHQNIVSYKGCYMRKGNVKGQNFIWIVMEYCGGGSIESGYKLLHQHLEEPEIASVIKECLLGLKFLHSCNKMHRDIKCGNILLNDDGIVKLADFGVSTQLSKTFCKRNTFIGTPYWMAPEVITSEQRGTEYDFKADIWSLGITALEMANCHPPMFDIHPMRVLFMIPNLPPPTLENGSW
ncbi:kinase-like protein [Neocallimastix lanati (nom. inval.)]|uniref:non-specific serine/threonine protein kinase n=1 Tax=Neocallimastix californiae TaxID=1754190 RepID=A0A1Y1YZI4_9FUNG|nr:kinase-like protein [Neocallimastix sp. JGI-2020a]ORY02965.1 kinase-like protein [Neocallimastix californiae]|eukprot:ORY02965.1 kinase-like protein [Neocallimastix californiae]